jgi:hypothetical protein
MTTGEVKMIDKDLNIDARELTAEELEMIAGGNIWQVLSKILHAIASLIGHH